MNIENLPLKNTYLTSLYNDKNENEILVYNFMFTINPNTNNEF